MLHYHNPSPIAVMEAGNHSLGRAEGCRVAERQAQALERKDTERAGTGREGSLAGMREEGRPHLLGDSFEGLADKSSGEAVPWKQRALGYPVATKGSNRAAAWLAGMVKAALEVGTAG